MLTAAMFAFMVIAFPYFSDDFWYLQHLHDYYFDKTTGIPWDELMATWEQHYLTDNIRLGNIVFTFFLLLPKWIPSLLSGLMIMLCFLLTTKICRIKAPSFHSAVLVCALYMFMLPWFDQMVILCFQFNYVWATVLALYVIYLLFVRPSSSYPLMFLAGLTLGLWHEGFGIPLLIGAAAIMVLFRQRIFTWQHFALLAGLAIGSAFLFSAPGADNRINACTIVSISENMLYTLKYTYTFEAFLLLYVAMSFSKRYRPRLWHPFPIFLIVASLVSYGIHAMTFFAPRISWVSHICSIIGIIMLIRMLWADCRTEPVAIFTARAGSSIVMALLFAHMLTADIMSVRLRDEITTALDKYTHSDNGEIFTRITTQYDAPPLSLGKPYYDGMAYYWNLSMFQKFIRKDVAFSPVPEELQFAGSDSGAPFRGTHGLRKFNGHLFMPMSESDMDCLPLKRNRVMKCTATFGKSHHKTTTALLCPFKSAADGQYYWYVYPLNTALHSYFVPLSSIRLISEI